MQQQTNKKDVPQPVLLVFFGMIAAGKSYLASAWAKQHDAPYYNSDRVRKELAGLTATTGQKEQVDQGIYTPEFSRRTYDALIEHADGDFTKGLQSAVVLDGSYQSAAERALLQKHFADRVRLLFVYCFCAESVVRKRLEIRASDPDAVSDGTWEIYLSQQERFQPIEEDEGLDFLELNTEAPLEELLEKVTSKVFPTPNTQHLIPKKKRDSPHGNTNLYTAFSQRDQ